MQSQDRSVSRRKYAKPELVVYGDVRQLTESASATGSSNDGAGKGSGKAKT